MQNRDVNKDLLQQLWRLSGTYRSSYEPDIETGLANLKARIKKDQQIPAPRKAIPFLRRQWVGRAAAVVALLIAFGFMLNLFTNKTENVNIKTSESLVENYSLSDGTTVWLNKHSALSFPKEFSENERVVQLEGEAFFQVANKLNQPFIVRTAESEVRVLGTAFNLRAYAHEKKISIEVEEGSVNFSDLATYQKHNLKAGDKLSFEKEKKVFSNKGAISWQDLAWKKKKLHFADTPIEEVVSYLQTNFQVNVVIESGDIETCLFNASFVDNEPESILKQLELAFSNINMKRVHSKLYQLSGMCR